jgi:YbgC/YbaW family acyl-CoA thioester hydrolase
MQSATRPTRSSFRYLHPLRVRWAEIDMQKIVFNGHYLMYFDTAVAGYWRALSMPYDDLHHFGGDLYVKKATVEYHASARYDDRIDVGVRCDRIGTSSLRFVCAVFDGARLLVEGELLYVFADPSTQTSKPVPDALRAVFERYERGEAMFRVELGDWAALGEAASALRREVFVDEQGIAADLEWDGRDPDCLHGVVVNTLGKALATGRLLPDGRIGRMAVMRAMRGGGHGRALLDALVDAARARGHTRVTLHAQTHVQPFYQRAGFVACGAPFEEAGIAHVEMVRELG